jgi:hypothetical protein
MCHPHAPMQLIEFSVKVVNLEAVLGNKCANIILHEGNNRFAGSVIAVRWHRAR